MSNPFPRVSPRWPLPKQDDWSTPFAEVLIQQLDLRSGLTILDIASGHGIPAFYLAEQVGPTGTVVAIDASRSQVASARAIQRGELPWLRFDCQDMRAIPASLPTFQRITGNLSVMFLRPNRFEAMRGVIDHLAPGGQVVLTFPSLGTFASIWRRIDQEMGRHGLVIERERLAAHVAERIRQEVEASTFEINGVQIKVTLSIGIASYPEHAKTRDEIIVMADRAMYCGKSQSRNVVYIAS